MNTRRASVLLSIDNIWITCHRAPWESLKGCETGNWVYLFLRNSFRGTLSGRVSPLLKNSYIYSVINEWEITGTDLDGAIHMVKTGRVMWVFPGWFWQGQREATGPGVSKGSCVSRRGGTAVACGPCWQRDTSPLGPSLVYLGWLLLGVMHQGARCLEQTLQYPRISVTNESSLVLVFSL